MNRLEEQTLAGRVVSIIVSKKLMITSVFLFVVVSGMFTTLLITPKYEATMSILVSRDRIDPQINPSDKNSEITQTEISDEEFNSELEIIKSIDVAKAVVTELNLGRDRKPRQDTWADQFRNKVKTAIYNLTKDLEQRVVGRDKADEQESEVPVETRANQVIAALDVVPTKKSRIIKVTYTDTDPSRAKRTLEKIYEQYVALHVKISDRPEAAQVFQEQTERFNEKLAESTNQLKQFDSSNGLAGAEIATQRELLLKQLYDTQAQVNATRTEIGEIEQRIAALRTQVASMPEQIQVGSVTRYVSALDSMKTEQVKLEQQRTDLLQKYKPNSRFIRENEERLQQLRRNIAAEMANPPQEKSFAINELRRRLETDLKVAETSLNGLKKKESTLTAQASRLSAEASEINGKSIERAEIERRRAINEEAYLLYQKKGRENQITQVLNREQVMNFSVVDQPRTDGQPKTPKPMLNLAILSFVGLFAGLAAALITARGNETSVNDGYVITAGELERRYGLPVLASVPLIEAPRPERLKLNS
jgi:uncharacterized protein involved in exopolysaccharide biosynthesis